MLMFFRVSSFLFLFDPSPCSSVAGMKPRGLFACVSLGCSGAQYALCDRNFAWKQFFYGARCLCKTQEKLNLFICTDDANDLHLSVIFNFWNMFTSIFSSIYTFPLCLYLGNTRSCFLYIISPVGFAFAIPTILNSEDPEKSRTCSHKAGILLFI